MADKLKITLTYNNAGVVSKARIGAEEFAVQSGGPSLVMGKPGIILAIPNVEIAYESPPEPTAPAAAAQTPAAA